MTERRPERPGYWTAGELPAGVRVGADTVITGDQLSGALPFARFRSRRDPGLVIGAYCTMDGVIFNVGPEGRIVIGERCQFQDAWLISDAEIRIGDRVVIGWRATIADADFHPLALDARLADAVACSPLAGDEPRRPYARAPVVIEDDVLIGPSATILKGVRVGAGAFVEAGAVVARDVPPGARVLGNPARVVGWASGA